MAHKTLRRWCCVDLHRLKEFLGIRRMPGRAVMVAITGLTLLFLLLHQDPPSAPQPAPRPSSPTRRIHDYPTNPKDSEVSRTVGQPPAPVPPPLHFPGEDETLRGDLTMGVLADTGVRGDNSAWDQQADTGERSDPEQKVQADTEVRGDPEQKVQADTRKRGDPEQKVQADTEEKGDPEQKVQADTRERGDPEQKVQADTRKRGDPEQKVQADTGERGDPEQKGQADTRKRGDPEQKIQIDKRKRKDPEQKVQADTGKRNGIEQKVQAETRVKGVATQEVADKTDTISEQQKSIIVQEEWIRKWEFPTGPLGFKQQSIVSLRRELRNASLADKIEAVLRRQRESMAAAMDDYQFHPELKIRQLSQLVPEMGGVPLKSFVVTTWRSGSTFIGDVLQSHPATFYHYEPFLDFNITQIRSGKDAAAAIHSLRHLMTCNYTDMDRYLNYGSQHTYLFTHNQRLWQYCVAFPELCWQPDFLTSFCRLFPFQSIKSVRLRLNLTREFLEDKRMNVQVLLLVRDPRGTMQSRHHRVWCPGNPDCEDPAKLCRDLVDDYKTALTFKRRFPHSFRVIRYEDLSFNVHNTTKDLFDFFHLQYHPKVQQFLDTHTKQSKGGVSSTFRNSMTAPIHWKQDLSWPKVQEIQKKCAKALRLWGYNLAKNEQHLRSFMPVGILKNY